MKVLSGASFVNLAKAVIVMVALMALPVSAITLSTRDVYGGQFNLPIPGTSEPEGYLGKGWMEEAVIAVPRLFVNDLNVRLTILHTNITDLQISLQSPSGVGVWLNYFDVIDLTPAHVGEAVTDYTRTVFDDEAPYLVDDALSPFAGRFKPKGPGTLSAFDGFNEAGNWRIMIEDRSYGDTGLLASAELIFYTNGYADQATSVPEPCTFLIFAGAVMLVRLNRGRKFIQGANLFR